MAITLTRKAEITNARKVDTEIADLWGQYHQINDKIAPVMKRARDRQKLKFLTDAEKAKYMTEAEAKRDALAAEAAPLRAAAQDYSRENYTGWTRFFLVKHIHSSQSCSSFRPTTRVGWLPDVSGLTEAEAVKEHGAILCTICFPTAPVEWTQGPQDDTTCAGSGKPIDHTKLTGREGSYYSPTGTCTACGTTQGLTARGSYKIRKHKNS